MWCLLFLPTQAAAQEDSPPSCKPANLDSQAEFFNGPRDYFTVALKLHNVSQDACILNSGSFLRFAAERKQAGKPFGVCDACEDLLPNGQARWRPPLVLNPGETAHQTLRWKTAPSDDGVRCEQPSDLWGPALLIVAPSLLKRVCSDIAVSRYYPGAFPGLRTGSGGGSVDESDVEMLVISSNKPSYYQAEAFSLHVSLAFPGAGSPTDDTCPTLFLLQRSPDGTTRLDETQPAGFKGCNTYVLGANRYVDWQTGFELDSGVNSRWGGIGTHSFQVLEVVRSPSDGRIQFAQSNELKAQVEDSSLISRKWGPRLNGVAVDVTLDKDTYLLGEDVPLHIALKNFDAPVAVYAIDPVWDPPAVIVQVRNSLGQLLAQSERSWPAGWMGHGRGPVLYQPDKLVPIELSLRNMGWLPNHSGNYTVFVTWVTYTGPSSADQRRLDLRGDYKPYATVQAAAVLRVVDRLSPTSH